MRPTMFQQIEPVFVAQPQVDQCQIDRFGAENRFGRSTIGGAKRRKTDIFQPVGHGMEQVLVVVNDQDSSVLREIRRFHRSRARFGEKNQQGFEKARLRLSVRQKRTGLWEEFDLYFQWFGLLPYYWGTGLA